MFRYKVQTRRDAGGEDGPHRTRAGKQCGRWTAGDGRTWAAGFFHCPSLTSRALRCVLTRTLSYTILILIFSTFFKIFFFKKKIFTTLPYVRQFIRENYYLKMLSRLNTNLTLSSVIKVAKGRKEIITDG